MSHATQRNARSDSTETQHCTKPSPFLQPNAALFAQVLHLWASAAARQTIRLLSNCPWEPLVVGALCPLVILVIAELLKRDDARAYDRYITLLRLEFDTRLGMHSPR